MPLWLTSNDDRVRHVHLRPLVMRWPKPKSPLAPMCWVLSIYGQGRQGLTSFPRQLPGFISRCFFEEEAWLNHKCCKSRQQRRGGCWDRLRKRGKWHSALFSLAVVQSGRSPDPEELCDTPPPSNGAPSGYGCSQEHQTLPDWTFQNGAAENWTSGKHTLFLGRDT